MSTVTVCLRNIEEVRRVSAGREEAYVARSRLSRLILRTTNLARHATSWRVPGDSIIDGEVVREIEKTCQELDAIRRSATHASEPLDERWIAMWEEILSRLDALQSLLETYERQQ